MNNIYTLLLIISTLFAIPSMGQYNEVFARFSENSSELSEENKHIINQLVKEIDSQNDKIFYSLRSFPSTKECTSGTIDIATQRLKNVHSYLLSQGVPSGRVIKLEVWPCNDVEQFPSNQRKVFILLSE
jgi:hypothetical protein